MGARFARVARRGLTLSEVLLATAILSTTAMLIYPMFVSSGRLQTSGRYRILAAGFARETMETLRARRPSDLPEGEGIDPILPGDHVFNTRLRGLRQWRIRNVVGPGFGGGTGEASRPAPVRGKLITVTVSWDAVDLAPGARTQERLVLFRSSCLPQLLHI